MSAMPSCRAMLLLLCHARCRARYDAAMTPRYEAHAAFAMIANIYAFIITPARCCAAIFMTRRARGERRCYARLRPCVVSLYDIMVF
jgi:hypothetical protein